MNARPFIPAWLDDSGLSAAEVRVFVHLCRSADNSTGVAWPSYARMTAITGLGKSTVRRAVESLEGKGMIESIGKPFGGSCRYRVLSMVPSGGSLGRANGSTTGTIEASNSSTRDPIEEGSIVPPQDCNSSISDPSIVPPEGQEGNPRKVPHRRFPKKEVQRVRDDGPPLVEFPLALSSPEFARAWGDWTQHRREIRKPLTPTSVRQQLAKLEAIGAQRAIEAIHHSIANGWQGIFEPSPKEPAKRGHRHPGYNEWGHRLSGYNESLELP